MWYRPSVKTAATASVISVADMKARLRIDHTDDDALIGDLIAEATAEAETWCGIFIMPQAVMALCDNFADMASVPVAPVAEDAAVTITYRDADNATQTLPGSVYELRVDGLVTAIVLKAGQQWPAVAASSRIMLEIVTGYASVPKPIRSAIALKVAERYENRENRAGEVMTDWDALLINFRTA